MPKVHEKQDIEQVYHLTQKPIIALIESPLGMANIAKIATSCGLFAMSFGFLDICEQLNVNVNSKAGEMLLNQCIHPKQVEIIQQTYQVADKQKQFAKNVVDYYEKTGDAVFAIDGEMVDMPVIKQAYRILNC